MRLSSRKSDDSQFTDLLDRIDLGDPVVSGPLAIVPIRLRGAVATDRDYDPLPAALQSGTATVTETPGSGAVPTVAINNTGDRPVFLLNGEELVGAKQNRMVNLSMLVPAHTTLPIPVSCVEQGRWSAHFGAFRSSPQTAFCDLRAMEMAEVTAGYLSRGRPSGDQGKVWNAISARLSRVGTRSETQAMADAYEAKRAALDDLLSGLEPEPDECGAVFALGGRVAGMDLFEFPEMFAAYFGRIVRGHGLDAIVHTATGEFSPQLVQEFLDGARHARHRRFKAVGLGDDLRLDDERMAGGALLLDKRVVHVAAFRSPSQKQ